jgi:SIR2-like domain
MYKIHGSIDWELCGSQIVKSPTPVKPIIIYPRNTKFEASYDQPFIEMMSRFQLGLRQPNTGLLIVGFGFNDRHIWQPIMSAVRSNVNLKAVVVDPGLADTCKEPVKEIENLIRKGDSRLVLLAAGFEDLVMILPDLVASTEEERHKDRLRSIQGTR